MMPVQNDPTEHSISDEMDELPPLTAEERAMFVASLEAAQRRIKRGEFEVFDETTFVEDLMKLSRSRKHAVDQ